MKIETAKRVVEEVVYGRKRWGKQFSSPYSVDMLYDALVLIIDDKQDESKALALKEELTTTRRQLAAANARVAKMLKKQGVSEDKDNTGE